MNNNKLNWSMLILSFLILAFIGLVIYLIVSQCVDYYQENDPKIKEIKEKLSLVAPEVVPKLRFFANNKSFTINKQRVNLCLADKKGKYYDDNMLCYVALHELAHVMCDEIGHTQKFQEIFQELLEKGEKAGIYNSKLPTTPYDDCM